MFFIIYYVIILGAALLCWPYTYGKPGRARPLWITLGVILLTLPVVFPPKAAFYYGLVGNLSMLFWTSDTFMGKEDWRARGLVGGIVLAAVPLLWSRPFEDWPAALLTPTVGHLVVSGLSTVFIKRWRLYLHRKIKALGITAPD